MKMKTVIGIAAAVGAVTALAVTIILKKRRELGFIATQTILISMRTIFVDVVVMMTQI